MEVTEFGIEILVSCVLANTIVSKEVIELGMLALVRLEHNKNAQTPMEVTELGIDTLVRPLQDWNASCPIEVTEFGIVTLVRLLHLKKA